MSDENNPLSGGLQGLMQQATQMQQQVKQAQLRAAERLVTGEAAGGLVIVTANGQMEITRVTIDPKVATADELDMLQDLIVAAVNEAIRKAQGLMAEEMSRLTGGLKIPGLG